MQLPAKPAPQVPLCTRRSPSLPPAACLSAVFTRTIERKEDNTANTNERPPLLWVPSLIAPLVRRITPNLHAGLTGATPRVVNLTNTHCTTHPSTPRKIGQISRHVRETDKTDTQERSERGLDLSSRGCKTHLPPGFHFRLLSGYRSSSAFAKAGNIRVFFLRTSTLFARVGGHLFFAPESDSVVGVLCDSSRFSTKKAASFADKLVVARLGTAVRPSLSREH